MKTKLQLTHRNTKGLLQATIYQQIGQPRGNGQMSRNIQSSKTESERNRKSEQTDFY